MTDDIGSTLSDHIRTEILKQPQRNLSMEEPLISSGLIDSFHLVDLALFVEDTYGVVIGDSELNASIFDNLDQLCDLIQARLG